MTLRPNCVMIRDAHREVTVGHIVKCFRSGNTLRVSILNTLRYQLQAQAGDYLCFDYVRPGVFEVTNMSEQRREHAKRKTE